MKNKNLIVITLLATVLLSSSFVSLAAARGDAVPDATPAPDPAQPDSSDNSTISQGDDILYTIQDNRTAADDTQVPGEAEPNLIATQTGGSDDTLPIVAAVIALAVVLGTVCVVFYRKKAANAEK